MILLQQFSMNQQDQRVSQALEKALAKHESVKGNSFSNCIINSHSSFVIYSYFNAFANKENIEFQLVSIFVDTKGEEVRVVVQKVEFEDYFKVKVKEAEELQFNVKTNPKDQVFHIVEMRMHSKNDEVKSKFFNFGLEAEMITQGEEIILSSISARKPIKQVHWHPDTKATFVALTTEDFTTYSLENRGDQVTTLKQMEINQSIVDFHFWKDADRLDFSYISALSASGRTYIIVEEDQFLQVKQVVDCVSLAQFNWTTIKVFKADYNKQKVLLSIKAGNIYKKNVKESMFQVYSLAYDEKKGQIGEKLIVRVNGIAGNKAEHDFVFPFQELFNSSLLYCHDNKIMRLNISKWLDFLTSKQASKTYRFHSKQAQAQIFIELDKVEVKFVLFKKGEAVIVRSHGSTAFNFSRTSTDINEFESQGLSITNKINKALKEIQEELNKKIEVSKEPGFQEKIELLPEEAGDADVDKFLLQTNKFIDISQRVINNEQDEIKRLVNEIKSKSERLEKLKYQKVELQKWEERIKENAEKIERLQEEQNEYKAEQDEKIEELGNMIEFVRNKPIDLNEEVKKECSAIIQSQISLIQDIERKYKLAEQEFNKLK